MTKLKKIITRFALIALVLVPVAAIAHYIIFPQETRSILVGFSSFKKTGQVYYNAVTPQNKIDSLQLLIQQASARVSNFWGEKKSNPRFIYCTEEADFKKYCTSPTAPAVTYLKLGAAIVISSGGADVDIIAHEISHAELYERIGFYRFNWKIPAWFKHGLAMQNDYRSYYSEDTLKAKTDNYKNLPDARLLQTDGQFYAGTREEVMLHYMVAKHEVAKWYTKEKLDKLVKALAGGKPFEEAFE